MQSSESPLNERALVSFSESIFLHNLVLFVKIRATGQGSDDFMLVVSRQNVQRRTRGDDSALWKFNECMGLEYVFGQTNWNVRIDICSLF